MADPTRETAAPGGAPGPPEAPPRGAPEAPPRGAPEAPPCGAPKWHLGFDCATKTFAFSLSRVDLGDWARAPAPAGARLRARAQAAAEILRRAEAALAAGALGPAAALLQAVAPAIESLDHETRALVRIADGETVDLFPGRPDDGIATVERVRAVALYVKARVRPALRRLVPPGEPARVVIEFQMGPNARARHVAAALVALFAEEDVIIVGPTLKNKIATCEEGRYCYFAERYATSYSANKAHARFNFARFEEVFGTEIPPSSPALRGHIADSFMQVIGHLVHGAGENAAQLF